MHLLEREGALTALADAHASAAAGDGRIVVVTGEPGIGKTALVGAFVAGLGVETKVLLGTCDDLSIARPLGAFFDLVGSVSAPLEDAILGGAPPQRLHPLLITELDSRTAPTVLVVEDVHWADGATLDTVTFLARRIAQLPALLVLTLRTGETPPDHPLHGALAAVAAAGAAYVELSPLSEAAVELLAGDAAAEIFAAARGNPFYVTELLEAREDEDVPRSVTHSVLGRLSRLDERERRLVELVAVVPRRVRTSLLDHAFREWPYAAAEPERRHLLDVKPHYVAFRHELVRAAIVASIPAATRRRLHADVLAALLATGGNPADIVHHAEGAGADDAVAANALVAARRAAALESNREAYAHYHRAIDFLDRYDPRDRAVVLEELTGVAYLVGRFDDALAATGRAREIWRELGDEESVGRCTRVLSRIHWFLGDGVRARAEAAAAVEILDRFDGSSERATAYGGMARFAMLAADAPAARAWANRAHELAAVLGDDCSRVNAAVTLATVEVAAVPAAAPLLEAHRQALAAGLRQEGVVALGNLGHLLVGWGLAREAGRYVDQTVAEADEAELHHHAGYGRTLRAWLRLRAGDWEAAERDATTAARMSASVTELLAQTVLAELAVRRGDPDADERLAALSVRVDRTGDLDRIVPVLDLLVERALISGGVSPVARLLELRAAQPEPGLLTLRLAASSALAGREEPFDGPDIPPYSLVARRDWRGAADAFAAEGWPYDRALMLSLLDEEAALVEALELARGLGAEPLARRATQRLRELGLRVPRGPYGAARENRAGLTARQLEVLRLVVGGRTNAEIADELVVSLRTAEHHVAAVLAKLGASSRRDAGRRAAELGLLAATA